MSKIMHKVKIYGKTDRRFKNFEFSVKFEYVFLGKYSDDFRFKKMLRINMTLALNFT
jgi:hypothetical protein